MTLKHFTTALMSLGGALLIHSTAGAQGVPPGQQTAPAAIEVSGDQLDQFADVQKKLIPLNQQYEQKLQSIPDGDAQKANEIRQEFGQKFTQAVEESPLGMAEYEQIAQAINSDEQIRERFQQRMMN